MDQISSRNGVAVCLPLTTPKAEGLRERKTNGREASIENLFQKKNSFNASGNLSSEMFMDFDDTFEEERDQCSSHVTPVDKLEQGVSSVNSPNGVDGTLDFDPFAEIEKNPNSFYKKRDFELFDEEENIQALPEESSKTVTHKQIRGFDEMSTDSGFIEEFVVPHKKSPFEEKLQRIKSKASCHSSGTQGRSVDYGYGDKSGASANSSNRSARRSTMGHLTTTIASPMKASNMRMTSVLSPRQYAEQSCQSEGSTHSTGYNRRAAWSKRASMSNVSFTSTQSDPDALVQVRPARRGGRRGDVASSDHSREFKLDSPVTPSNAGLRNTLGRRASLSNMNLSGHADVPKVNKQGVTAAYFSPRHTRRASIGMVPSPKKQVQRMTRRSSVATGTASEETAKGSMQRRASVSAGMGESSEMTTVRVKIRQNGKSPQLNPQKIDEDMVRRLVKEHLAKQRMRKQQQEAKDQDVMEKQQNKEINENQALLDLEDDSDDSESDVSTAASYDDDDDRSVSSHSTASSASSRWEDDTNNAPPRLLSRHVSTDDDLCLFDPLPSESSEGSGGTRGLNRSDKNVVQRIDVLKRESVQEAAETKDEEATRRKLKKEGKKAKKEKKEKKAKKEKKSKKAEGDHIEMGDNAESGRKKKEKKKKDKKKKEKSRKGEKRGKSGEQTDDCGATTSSDSNEGQSTKLEKQ